MKEVFACARRTNRFLGLVFVLPLTWIVMVWAGLPKNKTGEFDWDGIRLVHDRVINAPEIQEIEHFFGILFLLWLTTP